ncbi:5-methyltetrahydropteroyltriglutamate--homocysteine S-methyltransferase [Paenibacillus sp. WLX1005]|uniref:5-methyltetrahydropteroyltriglutamate-- homocysteine S-methyltransferase n=1 Tax=Paenibacillus sp. WLX1005 TaxID=3243766 RepID=UPI003984111E
MTSSPSSLQRTTAPFRADHVGSLLRTEKIKKARLQHTAGVITAEQLREIENEEIRRIAAKQEEIGLQSITDGEFRRAWWHFDFLEHLDGVEAFEAQQGIQFHGVTTKPRGIKVIDKIDFTSHPHLEDYKFLHSVVSPDRTAKMTIPSPNMLQFRGQIGTDLYSDSDVLLNDLGLAYQKALRAFYDEGCRYLQLDDTSWAAFFSDGAKQKLRAEGKNPDQMLADSVKLINLAVANRPDDMVITMHICRGNFRSTWTASGGYEGAADAILDQLNLNGLFMEFDDERSGSLDVLKHVKRKDLQLVLGLITSKHGELESKDDIKRRIDQAARHVNLDQLCLSPQCGFASTEEGNLLTEEQQWDKLRHVIEIAQDVWK